MKSELGGRKWKGQKSSPLPPPKGDFRLCAAFRPVVFLAVLAGVSFRQIQPVKSPPLEEVPRPGVAEEEKF
ncbi:MAG: hypothetical protein DA408_21325 [Bacteroidetes bacterium]|nr:MAG: hypothetical protein C7N36_08150 [Bacteroidota bacterium]PTM07918.1 MAG: hypothetical protein DA408_21325 [Bacteroidota bacterium]